MGKASNRKKSAPLDAKLARVVSAFGQLPAKHRRQFANAVGQDLTLGGQQSDYFRKQRNAPVGYPTEPDGSMTPVRVTYSVRMRFNPVRGLTFERLVQYLDQWRMGFFRSAGMLWDAIERRDYQMQICRPKRLKSVARHGYEILIADDVDDSQKALAQQQKDFLDNFYGNVSATSALNPDEEGGFSLLVRQMMDAVGKFYAVHEIVWEPLPSGELTAKFIFCPIWWFEGTQGKLRFLTSEFQLYGGEMLPGEWLITCGDGLMEACSVLYIMKSLMLKSWICFLDKFGMPGIHGKTDATKDSPEWNDFVNAVEEFAQEWSAVTNRNADISLVEAKASGDAGFEKAQMVFDRAITQLWRGGDLGTSSGKNATGASLQQDESEILETDDAKMIEETLESKVTKYALAWKFGPDAPALAYIKLRTTPRRNIQDDIAVDTFLSTLKDSQGNGLLGTQATLERYSRPVPKPGDAVLEAAPAAAGSTGKEIPPGKTDKNPEFSNANDDAAMIGGVISEMFFPLLDRVNKIKAALDANVVAETVQHMVDKLLADYPHIANAIAADDSLAKKLPAVLLPAFAAGMKGKTENEK